VLLLDFSNASYASQIDVKREVKAWLSLARPEDRLALCALGNDGGFSVLHDFTADRALLALALEPYQPAPGFRDPTGDPLRLEDHIQTAVEALRGIARHLGRLPGRKNLLWVSNFFPLPMPNRTVHAYSREFASALDELNAADVAVYPLDPSGLHPPPSRSIPDAMPPEADRVVMEYLADATGGRAFYDVNHFGAVLSATASRSGVYSLSFYPDHGQWNGDFHQIQVRVARPGLQLRYRSGYTATPDPAR